MNVCVKYIVLTAIGIWVVRGSACAQSRLDSLHHLPEVVVTAEAPREVIPGQKLAGKELEWNLHGYYYTSHRGLPGPIVKNKFAHGQRLHDENFFLQGKFRKRFGNFYSMKLNAKYANDYTRYVDAEWSVLGTFVREKVKMNAAAPPKNIFTPALILSLQPFKETDFRIQAFYKNIFRMPPFNDLYDTFIGNAVLHPEYATQYNIGFNYMVAPKSGWLKSCSLQTDTYYNRITDKIVAVPAGNMFRWSVHDNAYNPTYEDLKAGRYVKP